MRLRACCQSSRVLAQNVSSISKRHSRRSLGRKTSMARSQSDLHGAEALMREAVSVLRRVCRADAPPGFYLLTPVN
jgi:hypothetical protein